MVQDLVRVKSVVAVDVFYSTQLEESQEPAYYEQCTGKPLLGLSIAAVEHKLKVTASC